MKFIHQTVKQFVHSIFNFPKHKIDFNQQTLRAYVNVRRIGKGRERERE